MGATSYVYDANGNMTTRGSQTITRDVENRPVSVTGGGNTSTFVYDGDSTRVKKTEGGETILYINRYYEKNLTTSEVTTYYYLGGSLVAKRAGTTLEYVHQDHLASTSVVSDSSGIQVGIISYYPYGATRSGEVSTDQKFTGQRLDATGLYYYNARYYDATIGRFISADPFVQFSSAIHSVSEPLTVNVASAELMNVHASPATSRATFSSPPTNPQTLNRYSYVIGNPLRYTDPSGFFSEAELNRAGIYRKDVNILYWFALIRARPGDQIIVHIDDHEVEYTFFYDVENGEQTDLVLLRGEDGSIRNVDEIVENTETDSVHYIYTPGGDNPHIEIHVSPTEPSGINWARLGQWFYGLGEIVGGAALAISGVGLAILSLGSSAIASAGLVYSGISAILNGIEDMGGNTAPDLPLIPIP